MTRSAYFKIIPFVLCLLMMPGVIHAQPGQSQANLPPIEQPLVREGDFAVKLVDALNLATTSDEAEAESTLGSVGISPRNGWIADYPVTPDILAEIRGAIENAADSKSIDMEKDEALTAFRKVKADLDLEVSSSTQGESHEINPPGYDSTVINNYYYNQGPPIVTYYAPPPDYYYLYSWVPYPFWWFDFWFPGFFILNDFHRVHHFHHRTVFVSNHFNDFKNHRVFRIDPVDRFHGRTFAGIGAPRKGRFISPGVRNAPATIFNRNRISPPSGGRTVAPPSGGRTFSPPSRGGTTTSPNISRPSGGGRSMGGPSGGGRTTAPAQGGGQGSFGGMPRR